MIEFTGGKLHSSQYLFIWSNDTRPEADGFSPKLGGRVVKCV